MKVAPKIVFLFKDSDGLGAAFAEAFLPNPNSSFRRVEESFELPLDRHGIRDQWARGNLVHFADAEGNYQVSILLLEKYEPPTLVCAVSEVLSQITGEASSSLPAVLLPCVGASTKLKWENRTSGSNGSNVLLYSVQIGPETDITQAIVARTLKAPPSLQIQYEPLACFLQLASALNLPTSLLIGRSNGTSSEKASEEELKIIVDMGELLASATCMFFSKEKMTWNPAKATRESKEAWRALYG